MNNLSELQRILPDYPRTHHLPFKPNAVRDDLIVSEAEAAVIFDSPHVYIEEKVDAASAGMTVADGEPVIRNRNHILRKGYQKRTPAKMQFSSIYNWFYQNQHKFEEIMNLAGPVSVYGEWMFALHGLAYDALPDWFLTYDLFEHETGKYISPHLSREYLALAGFEVVPLLHQGPVESYEQLEALCHEPSLYASQGEREGVYVKVSDGKYVTHRFKMVRQGFIQGEHWNKKVLTKNKLKTK